MGDHGVTSFVPELIPNHRIDPRVANDSELPVFKGHINKYAVPGSCFLHMQLVKIPGRTIENLFRARSEEHTSELQSLMRISYAVFCLKKQKHKDDKKNRE